MTDEDLHEHRRNATNLAMLSGAMVLAHATFTGSDSDDPMVSIYMDRALRDHITEIPCEALTRDELEERMQSIYSITRGLAMFASECFAALPPDAAFYGVSKHIQEILDGIAGDPNE